MREEYKAMARAYQKIWVKTISIHNSNREEFLECIDGLIEWCDGGCEKRSIMSWLFGVKTGYEGMESVECIREALHTYRRALKMTPEDKTPVEILNELIAPLNTALKEFPRPIRGKENAFGSSKLNMSHWSRKE